MLVNGWGYARVNNSFESGASVLAVRRFGPRETLASETSRSDLLETVCRLPYTDCGRVMT